MLPYLVCFYFVWVRSLNDVVVSLRRKDLIPSLHLQLNKKCQKGISSDVTFMENWTVYYTLSQLAKIHFIWM